MKLGLNLLAGLANSIWSALIGLAVVPFYLKYLGIEAYGLIGFFVTTQAVLGLLDMGMAPTINREVARCSASGNLQDVGKLLHTLAIVYWIMAGAIALFILMLAPWIAEYWLQSNKLTSQSVSHALILMGLVIACRWPIGLYQSAIIGAQRLVISSTINIVILTISSIGAVAVLAFISPTIEAFFIWQACVGVIYALSMRWGAWSVIGRMKNIRFSLIELKNVWRFSAGMSLISLMGIIFTQMDKVLLSKFLGLDEFAHYMLATVVVSSLYILVTPFYNALYPRFSSLVEKVDLEELNNLYRLSSRVLSIFLFPLAMILVTCSEELVTIWTGNVSLAVAVAPIISLLAMGSALNGVMYIPHALQLAHGLTRLPLIINGILMVVFFPLIIFLALKFGVLGGALAWLLLHVSYVLLGTWLTHKTIVIGIGVRWLCNDIGVPLIISILAGVFAKLLFESNDWSIYARIGLVCSLAILSMFVMSLLTPRLVIIVSRYFYKRKVI